MANGLKCTDLCRIQDCTNRCDDDDGVPDDEDDHDDESCDTKYCVVSKEVKLVKEKKYFLSFVISAVA